MPPAKIIPWAKLALAVGISADKLLVICREVSDSIEAKVNEVFPERVPVATIAAVLGLSPEQANWDNISLHLQGLARHAAEASLGQMPTSAVPALTALSAGEVPPWYQLAEGPGLPQQALALALGLPESASEAEVLAELERIHN